MTMTNKQLADYIETAKAEAAGAQESAGEKWLKTVERMLRNTFGKAFSLDGDQKRDGYSLDYAGDLYDADISPFRAALDIMAAVRLKQIKVDEARATIREYWNSAEDDLSHLKRGEFEARIVAACNVLEDAGDAFDMFAVEHLVKTAPAIFDYDENGAYQGAVAYENGFTGN